MSVVSRNGHEQVVLKSCLHFKVDGWQWLAVRDLATLSGHELKRVSWSIGLSTVRIPIVGAAFVSCLFGVAFVSCVALLCSGPVQSRGLAEESSGPSPLSRPDMVRPPQSRAAAVASGGRLGTIAVRSDRPENPQAGTCILSLDVLARYPVGFPGHFLWAERPKPQNLGYSGRF